MAAPRRFSDNSSMRRCAAIKALESLVLAATAACSPTLNWREFQPDGVGLQVAFPCRPDRSSRPVGVPGRLTPLALTMLACEAGGQTFALAFADTTDSSEVTGVLRALRRAALDNIGAADSAPMPNRVPGTNPDLESGVIVAEGRLPDGRPIREHLAFFARGLRVYQAVVVGAAPESEAVAMFFGGLRAAP